MSSVVADLLSVCQSTKYCKSCGEDKPIIDFSRNSSSKDGLQRVCKICDNARQNARRSINREHTNAQGREYQAKRRKNFTYRVQMLVTASKQRASNKNREHSITVQDVLDIYPPDGRCPVFGFKLEFNNAGFRETSPSIDRIDSSRGYTKDNIQVISWKANRIKSYATLDELKLIVNFLSQGE